MNKLEALVTEISQHLNGDWIVAENRRDSYHLCSAEMRISISLDGYNWEQSKKVKISGVYPRYRSTQYVTSGMELPRIGCSISRGAEAIAKDIKRRFLPQYQEALKTAQEKIERYTVINDARWRKADDFIEIVDGRASRQTVGSHLLNVPEVSFDLPHRYSRGRAKFSDDVNLELHSIPVDLAMQVGVLVMEYFKEKR